MFPAAGRCGGGHARSHPHASRLCLAVARQRTAGPARAAPFTDAGRPGASRIPVAAQIRSEEHTSELQSQSNLVCRLLLEKKKKARSPAFISSYTLKCLSSYP